MTFSLSKFIIALVVAIAVGLLLVSLIGPVLDTLKAPIATTVGDFFKATGFVWGVLVGLWYYFQGPGITRPQA